MENKAREPSLLEAVARLGEAKRIVNSLNVITNEISASNPDSLQWFPQIVSMSAENLTDELNAIADIVHLVQQQQKSVTESESFKHIMERMHLLGADTDFDDDD